MKMHLETTEHNLISHYGVGVIGVNGQSYEGNVLISRNCIIEHWYEGALDALSLTDFAPLLERPEGDRPEIILLGSGRNHRFPPMQLMAELKQQGMALEVMNTRAACRTYSVLVSEYRPVAAALLQISAEE